MFQALVFLEKFTDWLKVTLFLPEKLDAIYFKRFSSRVIQVNLWCFYCWLVKQSSCESWLYIWYTNWLKGVCSQSTSSMSPSRCPYDGKLDIWLCLMKNAWYGLPKYDAPLLKLDRYEIFLWLFLIQIKLYKSRHWTWYLASYRRVPKGGGGAKVRKEIKICIGYTININRL